jgi:hypothetical protein
VDGNRFDGLIRTFTEAGVGRRNILKAVAGGALGAAVARAAIDDGVAKGKQGKKKKCVKNLRICPADPTKCCGKQCCTDVDDPESFCVPKKSTCCPGGGACPSKNPTCCPLGTSGPGGCAPANATCCPDGTTYCSPDMPTCCPPSTDFPDGSCCSGEDCCSQTTTSARRARTAAHASRPIIRKH